MYKLLFRNNDVLENTNVQLQVNGTSATTLDVQRRTTGTPPVPWSTVSHASFTSQNGQSTPNNPTNGDGSNGPGYYTDRGPEEEEGGWCAAAG